MGAALAPVSLLPSPRCRAGGKLSCFGCSVYSLPTHLPRRCPSGQVWVAQLPALLSCRGALGLGLRAHPCLWEALAASPGPALTPPSLIFSLLCPSTLCSPASPQLYLQARAPPEGDSDLATRLLTEPDVQKVPPSGQHHLSHAHPWACTP